MVWVNLPPGVGRVPSSSPWSKKYDDKKEAAEKKRAKLALERERKKQEKEVTDKEKKRL